MVLTSVICWSSDRAASAGILDDRLINGYRTESRVASYRVVLLERVKRHWSWKQRASDSKVRVTTVGARLRYLCRGAFQRTRRLPRALRLLSFPTSSFKVIIRCDRRSTRSLHAGKFLSARVAIVFVGHEPSAEIIRGPLHGWRNLNLSKVEIDRRWSSYEKFQGTIFLDPLYMQHDLSE